MRIKDRMLRLLDETASVSGRMRSLLEKTTLPVGTRHKWADGKVWIKQRDGSWAPEVARLPPPPATAKPPAPATASGSNAAIAATIKQGDESLASAVSSGKLAKGVSAEEHVQIAKDFLTKHSKSLDESTKALKNLMPEGCKVKSRVKELNSALGKLLRKPKYQRADNLQDATGMRVIAPDSATLDKAVEALKKNYKVVEMDDYTKDPLGGESGLGYRSFHAIIEDKDGLFKEVQLRTPSQDKHADWCHDVYKPRTPQQQEGLSKYADVIADYARRMGKYFAAVDSKKKADIPECPTPVQKFFACL